MCKITFTKSISDIANININSYLQVYSISYIVLKLFPYARCLKSHHRGEQTYTTLFRAIVHTCIKILVHMILTFSCKKEKRKKKACISCFECNSFKALGNILLLCPITMQSMPSSGHLENFSTGWQYEWAEQE